MTLRLTPSEKAFLLDRLEADCIQDVLRDTFDGITDQQANKALSHAIELVRSGDIPMIFEAPALIRFTVADAYDGSTLLDRTEDMPVDDPRRKTELRKVRQCIESLRVKLDPILREHADTPVDGETGSNTFPNPSWR